MPRMIGDLEDLITTIEHAARGQVQHEHSQAKQQAEQIIAEAEGHAERLRQEIIERAEVGAEEKRRQQLAQALSEAKRDYLTTREALLNQIWSQAGQNLRTLTEDADAYAETLERLAYMAARILGADHLILAADPAGHELLTQERLKMWSDKVGEALERSLTFERAAEPAETWGGMIITVEKDRRQQVDATFATRLELARDEIRETIFKRLVQAL